MAYGDSQDLHRRTAADKVLGDKAFHIAKNPNNVGYQRGIASMVYRYFDKKTAGGTIENEIISNKELLENLRKEKYTHLL